MYELTDSPVQLGLVRATQILPLLFLSPVAGTLADRYDRKIQMLAAQFLNVLIYAATAALILTGQIQPWHVYLTALGNAIVQVFQQPARQSMVSESVDRRHLTNAIALNSVAFNVSRSGGPALAGILIAVVGTGGSYVVQTALYLFATVWTLQLRPASRAIEAGSPQSPAPPSFVRGTLEGWRFIWRNEAVRAGMLISAASSLLAMPSNTLLPVFARDILHAGSTGQGLLLTGMGVGALFSVVLLASLADDLPKGLMMIGGTFLYGLSIVGFSASHWFGASVLLMVIMGIFHVTSTTVVQTIIQAEAPAEMRGRTMSIYQQHQILSTLGSMAIGGMAVLWGAQWAVGSMGIACALAAVAILVALPRARLIR
jgi:MFS family permease